MFELVDIVPRSDFGSCYRKNAYTRRKDAVGSAEQTGKKYGRKYYVYKCKVCNLWHVSHLKHKIKIGGDDGEK